MSIPGSSKSYPYWAGTYPDGVQSVGAGSNISITGTATNPIVNATVPPPLTGSIILWGSPTIPTGWIACHGEHFLQADYAPLYAVIGNNFSAGATNGPTFTGYGYTITSNEITFPAPAPGNPNVSVNIGCKVIATGYAAATGPNINGLSISITACPALGAEGTYTGTFDVPQANGTGGGGQDPFLTRTTFQTPNTIGITVRGADNSSGPNVGTKSGADSVVLAPNQLPSHAHGIPGATGEGYTSFSSSGVGYGGSGSIASLSGSQTKTDAIVYNSAGTQVTASGASGIGIDIENSYIALFYIIKT